jgi:hypothetical protein
MPVADSLPTVLGIAGISILLALGWLLLYLLLLRKNARLIREDGERTKVVKRRRLTMVDGECAFEIPDDCEISDGAIWMVVLHPPLSWANGVLSVSWRGTLISNGGICARTEVQPDPMRVKGMLQAIGAEAAYMSIVK